VIDVRDFTPLGDFVLVQPLDDHNGKIGNIFIPETADPEDKPRKGLVISVGPGLPVKKWDAFSGAPQSFSGRPREEMSVQPDDVILYGQWEGYEINLSGNNGKPYLVMRESGILGVIDD
jgi:co-chaperonin GroES (HSP10)